MFVVVSIVSVMLLLLVHVHCEWYVLSLLAQMVRASIPVFNLKGTEFFSSFLFFFRRVQNCMTLS